MPFNIDDHKIIPNVDSFYEQDDKVAWKFKHEFILNSVNQKGSSYTRRSFVDSPPTLIRECKPMTLDNWIEYYFTHAVEKKKKGKRITMNSIKVLGGKLKDRLKDNWNYMGIPVPRIPTSVYVAYIYNLTVLTTWDGYFGEEYVQNWLENELSEFDLDITHSKEMDTKYGVDKCIEIGDQKIGIQVKPEAGHAPQQYIVSATHKRQHAQFKQDFGGNVYWLRYNKNGVIPDEVIISKIKAEIKNFAKD